MIHKRMKLQDWQLYEIYCTYLNSEFLEAPREYILHGLVLGLDRAPFRPPPCELTSCCHAQAGSLLFIATVQVSHLAPLLFGWLPTNVQVNITTFPHNIWTHGYTSTSHQYYYSLFLLPRTSPIFLGRLAVPESHRPPQFGPP